MPEKKAILLDCDPGHDDAVAILMALKSEKIDLRAITVVAGNQTLEKNVNNTLHVCQHMGSNVTVYAGCDRPLLKEPFHAGFVHGESGLDGVEFEPLEKTVRNRHAVSFITDYLNAALEPVTVVATGPLTNIALALRLCPKIAGRIGEILLMGGSMGAGNITPAAEFNMFCDPEAADIVFRSGIPVRMVGLDVTQKAMCVPAIYERIRAHGGKACELFGDMMQYYCRMEKEVFGVEGGALHDPVTIAWLIDPEILRFEPMVVEVDRVPGPSYGRTNCDRHHLRSEPANAMVATEIDVERFWTVVEETLKKEDKS